MAASRGEIVIDIDDFDKDKLQLVEETTKQGATVLNYVYDGKSLVLKILPADKTKPRDTCFKTYGLNKCMEFDAKTKRPTNVWTGEWQMGIIMIDDMKAPTAREKRLQQVLEEIWQVTCQTLVDLEKVDEDAIRFKVSKIPSISKLKNDKGVVTNKPDPSKPPVWNVKCYYRIPKDAPRNSEQKVEAKYKEMASEFKDLRGNPTDYQKFEKTLSRIVPYISISGVTETKGDYHIKTRLAQCMIEPIARERKDHTKDDVSMFTQEEESNYVVQ